MIEVTWPDPHYLELQAYYNAHLPEVLTRNHYELATASGFPANEWKYFLMEPHVADFMRTEQSLINQIEMNKLTNNISSTGKSVGIAQNITALAKISGETRIKDGPVFVYMYVPLTEREQTAENIVILEKDPFKK